MQVRGYLDSAMWLDVSPLADDEAPLDAVLEALKDCLLQPTRQDAKSAQND